MQKQTSLLFKRAIWTPSYLALAQPTKFPFSWKPNVPKYEYEYKRPSGSYFMDHPIWDAANVEKVEVTHLPPKTFQDRFAYNMVWLLRKSFDLFSGFTFGKHTEERFMGRFIFLETVAAIPGMIGAITRHMQSLRTLNNDKGWIHHLLEEAENERQFVFVMAFTGLYVVSSKTAHRFVGYLEEEATKTYTKAIKDMDDGILPTWNELKAPKNAIKYWSLSEDATFRDVLLAIRADEVMHREVNHRFADMKPDASPDTPDEEPSAKEVKEMVGGKPAAEDKNQREILS